VPAAGEKYVNANFANGANFAKFFNYGKYLLQENAHRLSEIRSGA